MKVLVVGGIFGRDAAQQRRINPTPEVTLADGLESRGVEVLRGAHDWHHDLAGVDVVHVHHLARSVPLLAVRRLLRRRPALVFTRHGEEPHRPWSRTAALRLVNAAADAVVALSEREAVRLRREVRGRVQVIPNGIVAPDRPARPRIAGAPLTLLFVGQLIPLKNVDVLLRAVADVHPDVPVRLRLVFHNDLLRAELTDLVHRLGIGALVTFVGSCTPPRMAEEYRAADALVLPSSTESLPSVVTEALLAGVPVVASRVGGIPEQLADVGILVEPGSVASLATGLRELHVRYDELAGAARAYTAAAERRYSVPSMIDGHLALYDALGGPGSP